jgi:hypothetical protein
MIQRSFSQKVLFLIGYIVISTSLLVGVVFLYWSGQNKSVLQTNNTPFPVHPNTNTPDMLEIMSVDYCKKSDAIGIVVAKMVGTKSIIRLPWPIESQKKQCLKTDVPILIPSYATDDTYHFEFAITYKINPITTRTETLTSQSFTVHGSVPAR